MKKLLTLITVSVLLVCLTACSGFSPSQNGASPAEVQAACTVINNLIWEDYSTVNINAVTDTGFATLSASYTLTQTSVTYSIEQLNLLPPDGNLDELSPEYKSTLTGSARIENGRVVELDGSTDVALPSYSELKGGFIFSYDNLDGVVLGEGTLEAKVISPSLFYGTEIEMTELEVNIEYSSDALTRMTISYKTAEASVQTVYTFTK